MEAKISERFPLYQLEDGFKIDKKDLKKAELLHMCVRKNLTTTLEDALVRGADSSLTYFGHSLLSRAVFEDKRESLKLLLNHGADIRRYRGKFSPLSRALEKEDLEMVELLLQSLASQCNKNFDSGTFFEKPLKKVSKKYGSCGKPLLFAVKHRKLDMLRQFIKLGADVTVDGALALHSAICNSDKEAINILFEHGVDVKSKCDCGKSLISLAVAGGDLEIVQLLVEQANRIEFDFSNDSNLLREAAERNSFEIGQFLINQGCDVNSSSTKFGSSLHVAHAYNNIEFAEMLFRNGVDVNLKDGNGNTVLLLACTGQDRTWVEMLLDHNASVNEKNDGGYTPLWMLSWSPKPCVDLVELLLSHGADVHGTSENGDTILHETVIHNKDEHAKLFLLHGALVNAKNRSGHTALHLAAGFRNCSAVKLLLEHGADVNAVNNFGRTPLHDAFRRGGPDKIVLSLIQHGVDFDIEDNAKATALCYTEREPSRLKSNCKSALQHIARMKASNVAVNQRNLTFINGHPFLNVYYRECEEELRRMKQTVVCGNITHFDVLVNNARRLTMFAGNDEFCRFSCSALRSEYPIYGNFLIRNLRTGKELKFLLRSATRIFVKLTGRLWPVLVTDYIFKLFTSEELREFTKSPNK